MTGKGSPGRVGLTGADGMLGLEIRRAAARRGVELVPWGRPDLDVTEPEAVRRMVREARPAVVIHGAAWTDVDGCEADPERAMRVNGEGTANVVRACAEAGSRLVMLSTDYVFPGDRSEPWTERDAPAPISAYGRSKLAGEEAVRELGARGAVARTAWLYAEHGKNFLLTILRLGRERGEVRVVDDQVGSPTYAADLAEALLDLALSGGSGVWHLTNSGRTSWCGFARRIFEVAGLPVRVVPVTSAEFPRPARRPANSVLANTRLAEGIPALPAWEDGLARCLARWEADRSGGGD